VSSDAEADLVDIATWYAQRHPRGHERFVAHFESAVELLATFPLAGRVRPDIHERIRSYAVHPFVVFYLLNERERTLTIARVFHGHRDVTPEELGDEDLSEEERP
jgi:toxin ParE1/3/4